RAIDAELGGQAAFREAFTKAALTRFGSGWAWLSVTPAGKLVVESSASDEPLGVIHTIDVLKQQLAQAPLDLRALIRQPLIFPEQLTLLSALEQFRQAQTHFAFVVD
ncbi:Fe-Mn family superoxide dismutase, partial [Escherichia coli]|uniref:Fe-Mn family superoxide dismutase n=1 Tax=Escherichia coli TaxID=562 RepID=UPI0027D25CCE